MLVRGREVWTRGVKCGRGEGRCRPGEGSCRREMGRCWRGEERCWRGEVLARGGVREARGVFVCWGRRMGKRRYFLKGMQVVA